MRGIIVDNDGESIVHLKTICAKIPEVTILRVFKDKLSAAIFLQSQEVDFMVLDIDLPEPENLNLFQDLKNPPFTIIATENKHFALNAYEYDFVQDYILKPVDSNRFEKALLRIRVMVMNTKLRYSGPRVNNTIFVNVEKKMVKIDISEIMFIEAKGDYITIHTVNQKYTTYATLKKITQLLNGHQFIDIHRSYIINADKIIDLNQNSVVIGKQVLPISRYKRSKVFEQLNHL